MQRFLCFFIATYSVLGFFQLKTTKLKGKSVHLAIIKSSIKHDRALHLSESATMSSSKSLTVEPYKDFQYLKNLDSRVKRLSDRENGVFITMIIPVCV